MPFLAGLCGCFRRNDPSPHPPSGPEMRVSRAANRNRNSIQTGQFIFSDSGGFIPAGSHNGRGPPPSDSGNGGYASVVPLPQYTPRPLSIREKTLEAHLRDPPLSSDFHSFQRDEKSRNLYDEEASSDGSSILSVPSSYGNTSTATRETPPPPYSPRQSVMLSRTRSISISSAMAVALHPPPMARVHGSRTTAPSSEADDQSIRRHRRASWESR